MGSKLGQGYTTTSNSVTHEVHMPPAGGGNDGDDVGDLFSMK